MANDKIENKTVQIQTKVSPESYARLEAISKSRGISIFQLLRMMCDTMIRFMDDRHNLDYKLTFAMHIFEDMDGWRRAISLATDTQEAGVTEAFYILQAKKAEGWRIAWVGRPMLDGDSEHWEASYNIQFILERFIELADPALYKRLRMIAVEEETESLYALLLKIVDIHHSRFINDADFRNEQELRSQFENNNWHQGAKDFTSTDHYKRHHMKTIDSFEGQQKLFDDNQ